MNKHFVSRTLIVTLLVRFLLSETIVEEPNIQTTEEKELDQLNQENKKNKTFFSEISEPKECNAKLISLYSGKDLENEKRVPFEVSDLLSVKCKSIDSSCCLDDEFEEMTLKIRKSLDKIVYGINKMSTAMKIVSNLEFSQMEKLVNEYINLETKDIGKKEKNLYQALKYVKKYNLVIQDRMISFLTVVEHYSANLNCALCEAKNHLGLESNENNKKLLINSNMCSSFYNSLKINVLSSLILDFEIISTINMALISIYKIDIKIDPVELKDYNHELVSMKNKCNKFSNSLIESEECMTFCKRIVPFNKSVMGEYENDQATFIILIHDYFGTQKLLNISQNQSSSDSKKPEKIEELIQNHQDARTLIFDLKSKIHVKYFLPPSDKDNELNLNNLPIGFSEIVFPINQTKYVSWKHNFNFISNLQVFLFVVITLLFMK